MLSMRALFAFVLALAGLLWLPARNWAQNPQVHEQATALARPEPAATLAQVPPGHAVVTYRNGELTIKAQNAPLIDVLRAVCSVTGAVLDIPSGADGRVFASLGPGRASEVLASLLNDAQFNYAMMGSVDDPNALARVIVIPKTKGSNAENRVTQPPVSSRRVAYIRESVPPQQQMERPIQEQAGVAGSAGAVGASQEGDGNALDAKAVGSGANSPKVAPQAGATESDTAGADPGGRGPSATRRRHRRR